MEQKQIARYPADFYIPSSEVVGSSKLYRPWSFLAHRLADWPEKSLSPSLVERETKKQHFFMLSLWKEQKYCSYSWTNNNSWFLYEAVERHKDI